MKPIMNLDEIRDDTGKLPAYAWPGGYPILYLFEDMGVCCPACANGDNGSDATTDGNDSQWNLVAYDVHWEGPAEHCSHCSAEIGSAYGDPDATG